MMRKLTPIKNSLVCRRYGKKNITENIGGILQKTNSVDLYEIMDIHSDEPIDFKKGDIIMSCSTGDEMEINPNEIVYLFKIEHIMCKVEV